MSRDYTAQQQNSHQPKSSLQAHPPIIHNSPQVGQHLQKPPVLFQPSKDSLLGGYIPTVLQQQQSPTSLNLDRRENKPGLFEVTLDEMRRDMLHQQELMMNELVNLRHEKNTLNNENFNIQKQYMSLKSKIQQNSGLEVIKGHRREFQDYNDATSPR